MCFKDDRATLHLHGGITPWISDGTPHQWITPAGENTSWPQGVSVSNVPDMLTDQADPTTEVCKAKDDGCSTFYYTNQQSARLMFYHDHSYGITRLNVYAGEAAGYAITDDTEKKLVADGTIPGAGDTMPLIVQDRTFVPGDEQLKDVVDNTDPAHPKVLSYGQDPTWDTARWGSKGSFWYHHVYMPAQNPGDPSGMSAYGRWMYGPWFWPPATGTKYGPIDNPYYDPACDLDKPATWQYQTDPFCEPKQIPGTPNISMGMEQFNDTPVVNGVAYPKVTVQPKAYRLRLLNAANDRFFNFQWYTADPRRGTAGRRSPSSPMSSRPRRPTRSSRRRRSTPTTRRRAGLGADRQRGRVPARTGGDRRPAADDVDHRPDALRRRQRRPALAGDRTGGARRRDRRLLEVRGQDADPLQRRAGGLPGTGPVVRLLHGRARPEPDRGAQARRVRAQHPHRHAGDGRDTARALRSTWASSRRRSGTTAEGTGVFESGQNPVIVGQAAYNSAYGTSFAASSNCNV